MKSIRRRENDRKTIRAHARKSEALGNAAGWKREGNAAMWQELGKQSDGRHVSAIKIDGHHPGVFTPGKGNVTEKDK